MIKHKAKKCKAIGKAKGFEGCGEETLFRTYGLCNDCHSVWLRTTEDGQEIMYKQAMKYVAESRKDKKASKRAAKVSVMSADAYRKKYVQKKINEIIRIIDYGQPCIATGNGGQIHAGHYVSTGSNRTLTYNAHNIFAQSAHSNNWKGGDDKKYRQGLIDTFGIEYLEFIEGLQSCPLIKLNKAALETLNEKLIKYKRTVEKVKRSPMERIEERNRFNLYLGIYSDGYLIFNDSK